MGRWDKLNQLMGKLPNPNEDQATFNDYSDYKVPKSLLTDQRLGQATLSGATGSARGLESLLTKNSQFGEDAPDYIPDTMPEDADATEQAFALAGGVALDPANLVPISLMSKSGKAARVLEHSDDIAPKQKALQEMKLQPELRSNKSSRMKYLNKELSKPLSENIPSIHEMGPIEGMPEAPPIDEVFGATSTDKSAISREEFEAWKAKRQQRIDDELRKGGVNIPPAKPRALPVAPDKVACPSL